MPLASINKPPSTMAIATPPNNRSIDSAICFYKLLTGELLVNNFLVNELWIGELLINALLTGELL